MSREFLQVIRELWRGKTVDLHGEHVRVEDAAPARVPDPVPEVYFGGSSPIAGEVAARHADVHLTWGAPPAQVAEKIARLRSSAAAQGRTLRFGIRLHVITRDTAEQAWADADRLLDGFDPETVASVRAGLARSEPEGQQRVLALHGGRRDRLGIHPNLSGQHSQGVLPRLAARGPWLHPASRETAPAAPAAPAPFVPVAS